MSERKQKSSLFDKYVFLILVAFEILISFTFLGYIHISPVSVTFAYIPILIAACVLNTAHSTLLGVVFGFASMYKSNVFYALSTDMMFSPFLSGNAFGSVVLSLITRTLFGFLSGLAFSAAKKSVHKKTWIAVFSMVMPMVHALLVMGAIKIFFAPDMREYFLSPSLVLSNGASAVCAAVIMELVWKIQNQKFFKDIKISVDQSKETAYINSSKKHVIIWIFTAFVIGMTVAAALYFSDRMSYMLFMHNIDVSQAIESDLTNLQIQFMAAMISLNVISIVILVMGYKYASYKNFLNELDAVTGVMEGDFFLPAAKRRKTGLRCKSAGMDGFCFWMWITLKK